MSYNYFTQKPYTITDKGGEDVMRVRDFIEESLERCGAIRMQEIQKHVKFNTCDCWEQMACIDRLVELGRIEEVTDSTSCGQYRIFTRYKSF